MLFSKNKVVSLMVGTLLLSSPLLAEIKVSGSTEIDLMYKTNQVNANPNDPNSTKARGSFGQEADFVLNIDGIHEGNAIFKTLKWRVASKVATDYRYDPLGIREAWVGGVTDIGEFRFGNQFSNLYLLLDWPYGSNGTTNLTGDFGAHEVQYSRALSYYSPNLAGFSLSAQYDMGGKANHTVYNTTTATEQDDGVLSSYATEVVLTYDSQYVQLNGAYYRGVNSGTMDFVSDVFGGSKSSMGSAYGTNRNTAEEYYLGAIFKLSDFKLFTGYSHSHLKPTYTWEENGLDIAGMGTKDIRINKILLKGQYDFMQKHSISIGYVKVFDSRIYDPANGGVIENNEDGLASYYSQYNYALTEKISLFGQVRYAVLATRGNSSWNPDGIANNAKTIARFLVGTAVSF